MRFEAHRYITEDRLSKIPYLGRDSSVRFIDFLYKMGAQSVEISQLDRTTYASNFITELYVRISDQEKVRDILILIFKTWPTLLEESETRVFRIEWKNNHETFLKRGLPKI